MDVRSKVTFVWGISATIMIVGFSLDLGLGQDIFPRSGALLIAFVFGFLIWEWREYREIKFLQAGNRWSDIHDKYVPDRANQTSDTAFDVGLSVANKTSFFENRLFLHEALLFAIGTIAWGFGDWLVSLTQCGKITCSS